MVWLPAAIVLRRFGWPTGLFAWLSRIGLVLVWTSSATQVLTILVRHVTLDTPLPNPAWWQNPTTWFGFLQAFPHNALALLRSAVLTGLAVGAFDASRPRSSWPPGPSAGSGPDQATRLLCGHAFLAGSPFCREVLDFFHGKWTATAPEFGLDIHLLASVCLFAEERENTYDLIFAGVGVVSLLVILAAPGFGVPIAILVTAGLWYRKKLRTLAHARSFDQLQFDKAAALGRFKDTLDKARAEALPRRDQNLVVYRGFVPFVGAGLDLGGWSFVTFVDKPKTQGGHHIVRPFTLPELYTAVDAGIAGLRVAGFRSRDFFFVRGLDIRNDASVMRDLAQRPAQLMPDGLGASYIADKDERVRYYRCIQIVDWGGDIVVSCFLHCSLQGNTLLIELKRYLLPPLADAYRGVDRLSPDRLPQRIGLLIASLVAGPLLAVLSPFIVLGRLQEAMGKGFSSEHRRARQRRRLIENDPTYDFGAFTSLRARFAQSQFLHYFQKSDADFGSKLIERKILDELARFLDAHGIDTSDIRDRQTTILNSGILVQGGDVRAESLAVGTGARATKTETHRTMQARETVT